MRLTPSTCDSVLLRCSGRPGWGDNSSGCQQHIRYQVGEIMELEAIVSQAKAQIDAASDAATLDQVRVEFMGKKGKLTDLLKGLGQLSAEERPLAGQKINVAKQEIQHYA